MSVHETEVQSSSNDEIIQAGCDNASLPPLPPFCKVFLSLLKDCIRQRSISDTRRLHARLTCVGLERDALLGNFLVVAFANCAIVDDALDVSGRLPCLTISSWAAIICANVECGRWLEAIDAFKRMQACGFSPVATAYASILKAFGNLPNLAEGRILHGEALKRGFASKVCLGNTLISMYGKCGAVEDAASIFCTLPRRSVISWTAMLSVYLEQSQGHQALRVFRQMIEEGVNPNIVTLKFTLKACNILAKQQSKIFIDEDKSIIRTLEVGRALHAEAGRKGFASNLIVCTALLCLYDKCGVISEAENVFDSFCARDVAMWNSMLAAYKNQESERQSLLLYVHMQEENFTPNQLTFVIALESCCNMAKKDPIVSAVALEIGRGLHCDIKRMGYMSDVLVGTALLNMYGECGALVDSEIVFGSLPLHTEVTWTAMLFACLNQGEAEKAILYYSQMHKEGAMFDDISFLAVLQICTELGCLDVCRQVHTNIVTAHFENVPYVETSLIHGYANGASLHDGQAVFASLTEPILESWNSCIGCHAAVGDLFASVHVYEELIMAGMNPDTATYTPVLTVCSHWGSVTDNAQYLQSMTADHGLNMDARHFVSTADNWGRAGHVKEAYDWLKQAHVQADSAAWSSFLGACRIHGNIELAKVAFEHVLNVFPEQGDAYVILSNLCMLNCDYNYGD